LNKKLFLLALCITTVILLYGCGVTTLDQKRMGEDLTILQNKVADLEKGLKPQLDQSVKDAVNEISGDYEGFIETSLKNQASTASELETIRLDFRRVEGEVEEIVHKVEQSLEEDKDKMTSYDMRIRDLELDVAQIKGKLETLENNQKLFTTLFSSGIQPPTPSIAPHLTSTKEGEEAAAEAEGAPGTEEEGAAPAGEDTEKTAAESAAAAKIDEALKTGVVEAKPGDATDKIPAEVQAEYDKAYGLFTAEKFDEAMETFIGFIKKHPDTELTDNAQYWTAECFYKKKEFDKAILEYDKMVADYPDSDKVPSALLKEGFSFLQLNYKDEAVIKLKKLVEDYPNTNQAEIARRKLKVIK
jgi:tol-pal system protein YbgF